MSELARYELQRRLRGSIYLSIGMAAFAALVIWVYPSFAAELDDEFLAAYPEQLRRMFNIETMTSIEGFLSFELYSFGWVILLGLYLAYLAAGTIADDIETERMDVILAMPLSRRRVLGETYLGLAAPILAVNVLVPPVVFAATWLIGEPIGVIDLVAIHVLSIPYLLACAAIGLLCSVVADRSGIAQRLALGGTFGLFMIESLLEGTDFEAIGYLTPMGYFDPNAILLDGVYDPVNVIALLAMTGLLLLASGWWFGRRDL